MEKDLRTGFTTGACAAAAAKAAVMQLLCLKVSDAVDIPAPVGKRLRIPVVLLGCTDGKSEASVTKDAGSDPDITNGLVLKVSVSAGDGEGVTFAAGEGVGVVTLPGLQVPPGEPAINPGPRRMITEAIHEVTDKPVHVEISIPGGAEIAQRTFNPRLGIKGGLSILGTTGVVRPFSVPALRDALVCALDVAIACNVRCPVLVPGNIGERAARRQLRLRDEQVVQVSNEWGFMLECAAGRDLDSVMIVGHPGKLAKLADGQWDTHSSKSASVVPFLCEMAAGLGIKAQKDMPTAEGLFVSLDDDDRRKIADKLASKVKDAVEKKTAKTTAVMLVSMEGDVFGTAGDLSPWQ